MVKGGLGSDEIHKVRFWQLALSELLGTMLVVLVSSLVVGRHDGKTVILTVSLMTGLAYSVVLFIFGNHGYFNPAITVSLFVAQRMPLIRMGVYVFSQLIGALLAQLLAGYVMLQAWYTVYGPGAPLPSGGVNLFQVFVIEMVGSAMLSAVISTHCSCVIIGLTITLATSVTFPFTMGCLNPARALAAHIVSTKFPHYCWVYWLAPILGATLGRITMLVTDRVQIESGEIDAARTRLLSESN